MTEAQLPRYLLHERLGEGGMGAVHLGTLVSPAGERRVAIKRLIEHGLVDADATARLVAEAKLVFQLTHVNICQVLDLGAGDDGTFIVMEYVNGLDLRGLLRFLAKDNRQLDIAMAVYVAREVARALDYAHRRCDPSGRALFLVHGDVTPQNVLLSVEGEVKLADFGIARALGTIAPGTRLLGGTPGFVAPEATLSDQRDDIYALGVTLHTALTGALPPEQGFDARGLRTLRPEVTPELARIVERATERKADDRYASAGELESALALELARKFPSFTPSSLARAVEGYTRLRDRTPAPPKTAGGTLVSILQQPDDENTPTLIDPARWAAVPRLPPDEEMSETAARLHKRPPTVTAARLLDAAPKTATSMHRPVPSRGRRVWLAIAVAALVGAAALVWMQWRGGKPVAPSAPAVVTQPASPASPSSPGPGESAPAKPAIAQRVPVTPEPSKQIDTRPAKQTPADRPRSQESKRRHRSSGRSERQQKLATAPKPDRTNYAFLTINSIPWGAVIVDGKRVGDETPIYRLQLAPGKHRVQVLYLNQPQGAAVQELTLAPGEVRSIGFKR
ncbi:MAG: serine/threonine-protein kinase [Kofleriaceae bacterium]